jgi:hypothetical protein
VYGGAGDGEAAEAKMSGWVRNATTSRSCGGDTVYSSENNDLAQCAIRVVGGGGAMVRCASYVEGRLAIAPARRRSAYHVRLRGMLCSLSAFKLSLVHN